MNTLPRTADEISVINRPFLCWFRQVAKEDIGHWTIGTLEMMAQVNGVLNSVTRLPKSGILSAWLTSPGPIAGVSVNVGLASLDAAIDGRNGAKSLSSNEVFLGPGGTEIGLNTDPNAHLSLIPFIMEKFAFKKTKRLSESQLTARLERLIGCASAKSHRHSLFLAGTVPESHIGSCTELLGELMHGPAKYATL